MSIAVLGNGAFGTALALALAGDGSPVTLWGRDEGDMTEMQKTRKSGQRLPGHDLPESLALQPDLTAIDEDILLLSIPTQKLGQFLTDHADTLGPRTLIACCKGIDRATGLGPVELIERNTEGLAAILTGPSFAADIARGLPTALVLASTSEALSDLQQTLTRPSLRIYATTDTTGAVLGGALKNIIALAAGMAIGAGFGDSARAAVIARGFAEMTRYAAERGAKPETLTGLSGLGDLVLTCTSEKSRNFSAGVAMGEGQPAPEGTVEGIATAAALASETSSDTMPITHAVHAVATGAATVADAVTALLSRPVTKE